MDKYVVMVHKDMGCALLKYNREGCMFQQVSKWYLYYGNLYRFVLKPMGLCPSDLVHKYIGNH